VQVWPAGCSTFPFKGRPYFGGRDARGYSADPRPQFAPEQGLYSKDCTRICRNHFVFFLNLPQGKKNILAYAPRVTRLAGYNSVEVNPLGDS
jgi:hypothetical protein